VKYMSLSEQITYATVLLACELPDGSTSRGTGFIVNLCHNEEAQTHIPVVITNEHVVKNSIQTTFEFCKATNDDEPIDNECVTVTFSGNPWLHHPDKDVDLCCLALAPKLKALSVDKQNVFYMPLETSLIPTEEILESLFAIEDVVMVGYPIGLADHYNHKPIIRRGITASHPKYDYQGKKETLIDMACFPGSSGSPVFILNEGLVVNNRTVSVGDRIIFLGVLYGGPQYTADGILKMATLPGIPHPAINIPTNLGIIIKAERILEFEQLF